MHANFCFKTVIFFTIINDNLVNERAKLQKLDKAYIGIPKRTF